MDEPDRGNMLNFAHAKCFAGFPRGNAAPDDLAPYGEPNALFTISVEHTIRPSANPGPPLYYLLSGLHEFT